MMPSFKKSEYEVKGECDELFTMSQDVALLLTRADYFSERAINLNTRDKLIHKIYIK